MLSNKKDRANGPTLRSDGPRLSALAAQTVSACVESIRVPDFLRHLLAKSEGLTREPTCNGSKPPAFIEMKGYDRLKPPQWIQSNLHINFTLFASFIQFLGVEVI
jgi:hypothetical protein